MATLKRRKTKKEFKTSNIILFLLSILLILFTLRCLYIVEATGNEPSTLITAVFAAALGECGILGWIKNTKIKNGENNDIGGVG